MAYDDDIQEYVIDLMKSITEGEGDAEKPVFVVEKGLQEKFSAINKPVSEVSLGNTFDIKYGFAGPLSKKLRIIVSVNVMGLTEQSETEKNRLIGLIEDKIVKDPKLGGIVTACFITDIQREKIRQINANLYNSALIILTALKQY